MNVGAKVLGACLAMTIVATPAWSACGAMQRTVRDWGLHRAWVVVEDCAHPEKPARLREIVWTADAGREADAHRPAVNRQKKSSASNRPPEVRAGMRVRVWKKSADGEMNLTGTALEGGRTGDRVRVGAGLGSTILRGIVRGPGLVELTVEGAPQPPLEKGAR
jgi:hypothetical protein